MAAEKRANESASRVGDEVLLKIAKEIAIKFIEVGRMTPAGFPEGFESIYLTVKTTVRKGEGC